METLVIHNGHRIVVKHHLDSLKLLVDDIVYDEISGLLNTNQDNVLKAVIKSEDDMKDEIVVEYFDAKLMKLTGKLLFYYNKVLIAEKRTL